MIAAALAPHLLVLVRILLFTLKCFLLSYFVHDVPALFCVQAAAAAVNCRQLLSVIIQFWQLLQR